MSTDSFPRHEDCLSGEKPEATEAECEKHVHAAGAAPLKVESLGAAPRDSAEESYCCDLWGGPSKQSRFRVPRAS